MPYNTPQKRLENARKYRAKNRIKMNAVTLAWGKKNPRKLRSIKLKNRFGITLEEYEAILERQGGVCLICFKTPKAPVVDHSHRTGEIRGILCREHNSGIGMFGDSIYLLSNALEYLKKYGE